MKRIIVFRFHKLPTICRERLRLLRRLNPSIEIYGLFGGETGQLGSMKRDLAPEMEDIFSIAQYAPSWKWRFSDLAFREWFINVGVSVKFDVANLVEWDLLFCRSLDRLYSHIPAEAVGLTAIRAIKDIGHEWPLTAVEPFSLEWQQLLAWAKETHGYSEEPRACLGPGCCVPRSFLELYAMLKLPEVSTDELRLPLTAQLLGFSMVDTHLCRAWFLDTELEIFNTVKKEVHPSTVVRELNLSNGRRCFHPFMASLGEVNSQLSQEAKAKHPVLSLA